MSSVSKVVLGLTLGIYVLALILSFLSRVRKAAGAPTQDRKLIRQDDQARSSIRPPFHDHYRLFKSHVFVSYQSDDLLAAQALTHGLQEAGLRPWWDRDTGEHAPFRPL